MNLQRIKQVVVCAALVALCVAGAELFSTQPVAGQETRPGALHGAATLDQLKQDGQYESLQAALRQARFSVSRAEATPLGRAAWHAPNPAAGYDAYVTEAGVSIALNDGSYVSLSLHSLGYGHAMQGVAPGKVSGDKQTINITRDNGVQEWYVNGPDGLEQGFTLAEPLGARHPGVPLRLALQVSEGWRAVASEDGQRITLRGAHDQAVEYSKLVVSDSQGRNIPARLTVAGPARLTVAEERVVIEVEDSEAAYPLTIDPIFTFQQKLVAADAANGDFFGQAVALSGNTLAVGANNDDIGTNQDQGSVYVFTRSGAVWAFQQKITAFDGAADDNFGDKVALYGDTLAVGAVGHNLGANANQGAAYVFTRSGATQPVWTLQAKITAFDGAAGDGFGGDVTLGDYTLVVGAHCDTIGANACQGSAYVYTRIGTVWSLQKKLFAGDGAADDHFGDSVALSGDTVAVGAWGDETGASHGSAYVFKRFGTIWLLEQKLFANDGAPGDFFGSEVAIDGDTLVADAAGDTVGSNFQQGSAYVYFRNGGVWTLQKKLTANDGAAEDNFGTSVAIRGDIAVVSAFGDDVGTNKDQGSVYVFTRSGAVWTQTKKLTAFDGAAHDNFGHAVALSSDALVVGAHSGFVQQISSRGSAYVFAISPCPALTFAPASLPGGASGASYQQQITVSGGAGPYQFGLIGGALPPGLSLMTNGSLAGILPAPGTYNFTLSATDLSSGCSGSRAYTITVTAPCSTLTIDPPALPNGATGAPYSETLMGTGGVEPYKFAAKGKLLPGLSLNADGGLSGAPTQAGSFSFTLVVSDARGCASAWAYSITITEVDIGVANARRASSAPPPLTGEAAVNRLKEQGLYSSLIQAAGAARAARGDARSLPSRSEQDAAAASSPAAAQAIDLPFTQLLRQTARDGAANDSYGWSVAATDDTVVVGAYLDTVGTNARQGSAYVFSRSGGDWTFQQKLTANDGEAEERFGSSVAISGDTIVAGAPLDRTGTNYYHGSAYVFARSGGVWSFQQKLTAHDGAAYDQFGYSVAISGGTVVAGAFSDDNGAKTDQGSAYVFVRSSGVWSFQQKLVANDGEANDQFGAAVAISGGTVIAGAILDDLGASKDAGSAYVFTRSGTAWTQQQKLVMAGVVRTSDLFGAAVAISGDTALIGAPLYDTSGVVDRGLAAVFVRSGSVWSYQGALAANDGAESDQFGNSVAINGDTALIGAHFDDIGTATGTALDQGSAYLFTRSGTLWAARQRLTAQGGAARDLFGQSVALSGDKAIVGAPHAKVGDNAAQGALYLYGCGYLEQPQFSGAGGAKNDKFGGVVALDGDTAVVGAPDYRVGTNYFQGSAYIFARSGANWRQVAQLFAPEGKERDRFGYSVAISGDTIVVGAPGYDTADLVDCGAAFFYFRSGGIWTLTTRAFGFAREDHFGRSVAASGSLIAISSPYNDVGGIQDAGAVFLFRRTGASLSNEGRLNANDGAARDFFGSSVAVSGDRMLVGAPGPNEGERSKGAAYVFERSSTSSPAWRQHAKLLADDGELFDHLGDSVALSGNTALVSAPGKSNNTTLPVKAAYVFVGPGAAGGNWSQQARLLLGGGSPTAPLAVALSGNTAVVGSSAEPVDGRFPGTAHVFTRSGAVWPLQQQLLASNGEQGHRFGAAVALSGDTIMVGAPGAGNVNQGAIYVLKKSCGAPAVRLASVSAASFDADGGLAPESITALFGVNLATETQASSSLPLPAILAGVSLKVTDSAGEERLAPLFFVSPGQINYVIPAGTANGQATLTVMNAGGPVASGEARIASAAPGLFSANSSGEGVAAALALRIKADGSQKLEPVAQFDPTQNHFVPVPIDLGPGADQVFLVFYGTGLRFRSSLSTVSCAIGGVDSEALFAGAVPGFAGLDQVNVRLPRSLAGRGEVGVALFVDGEAANTVRVSVR